MFTGFGESPAKLRGGDSRQDYSVRGGEIDCGNKIKETEAVI